MAITLITGIPGSGKSLEAVRMMRDDYPNRKIYAANFPGLAYDFLNVTEFDPLNWAACDSGSILFIDEAWEYFEARGPHKMPPDTIKELARHRHYGLDIVLICQGPFQLDSHVRALVEDHFHVIRPFGMSYSIVRRFRGVEAQPGDRASKVDAVDISKRRRFDKSLFDYYKSAEVHTQKRKIPVKMIGAIAVCVLAVVAGINLFSWGSGFMDRTANGLGPAASVVPAAAVSSGAPAPVSSSRGSSERVLPLVGTPEFAFLLAQDQAAYFLAESLAVPGAPWTARKFAGLRSPVVPLRPFCALVDDVRECFCLSQQGTRLDVDKSICIRLARDGFFDASIADRGGAGASVDFSPAMVSSRGVNSSFEPDGGSVFGGWSTSAKK